MKESKNFWSINIKDIKQDTFDLSIKNLNAKEERCFLKISCSIFICSSFNPKLIDLNLVQ
jgi:hypothetical protein